MLNPLDFLKTGPISRVTTIRFSSAPVRKTPKAGDRRTTKKHGLQIRGQCMARNPMSRQPIGLLFANGRPVYDWRKPSELDPWDLHHLTAAERAELASKGGAA